MRATLCLRWLHSWAVICTEAEAPAANSLPQARRSVEEIRTLCDVSETGVRADPTRALAEPGRFNRFADLSDLHLDGINLDGHAASLCCLRMELGECLAGGC